MEAGTNPPALIPLIVSRAQPLSQGLFEPETVGAVELCPFDLRQQHFPRDRQQEEPHAPSDWTASGAREAKARSNPRQAAMLPRAQPEMSLLPSILWGQV